MFCEENQEFKLSVNLFSKAKILSLLFKHVPVHISMLQESAHDVQCVVAAQLQQELFVVTDVGITMSIDHIPPYPGIVPNMCIEVPQ